MLEQFSQYICIDFMYLHCTFRFGGLEHEFNQGHRFAGARRVAYAFTIRSTIHKRPNQQVNYVFRFGNFFSLSLVDLLCSGAFKLNSMISIRNSAENTMWKQSGRNEKNKIKTLFDFFFISSLFLRSRKSNYERSSSSLILHYAGYFFFTSTSIILRQSISGKKTFASVKRFFSTVCSILLSVIDISFEFIWLK